MLLHEFTPTRPISLIDDTDKRENQMVEVDVVAYVVGRYSDPISLSHHSVAVFEYRR